MIFDRRSHITKLSNNCHVYAIKYTAGRVSIEKQPLCSVYIGLPMLAVGAQSLSSGRRRHSLLLLPIVQAKLSYVAFRCRIHDVLVKFVLLSCVSALNFIAPGRCMPCPLSIYRIFAYSKLVFRIVCRHTNALS